MSYPIIDVKRTGENIKNICEKKNITVKHIQNYMQFACPQTVYRWFHGKALPSVDNFFALSKLLDIPMEKLIIQRTSEYVLLSVEFEKFYDEAKMEDFMKRMDFYLKKGIERRN